MNNVSVTAEWCGRLMLEALTHDEDMSATNQHPRYRVIIRAERDVAFVEAVSMLVSWMNEEGK